DNLAEAVCDDGVRLVPAGLGQHPVKPDEGLGQPVGIVVELAETRPLRTDETRAEDVIAVASGAGHPALGDGERQAAGGLAKGTDPQGRPGMSHSRIFLPTIAACKPWGPRCRYRAGRGSGRPCRALSHSHRLARALCSMSLANSGVSSALWALNACC